MRRGRARRALPVWDGAGVGYFFTARRRATHVTSTIERAWHASQVIEIIASRRSGSPSDADGCCKTSPGSAHLRNPKVGPSPSLAVAVHGVGRPLPRAAQGPDCQIVSWAAGATAPLDRQAGPDAPSLQPSLPRARPVHCERRRHTPSGGAGSWSGPPLRLPPPESRFPAPCAGRWRGSDARTP
jgi:hypothetical protein